MIVSQTYLFLDEKASELRKDYEMLRRFFYSQEGGIFINC